MIVNGHNVKQEWIDVAFLELINHTNFTAKDLELELRSLGCNKNSAYRAADRLLQKWKKHGKIFYDKGNKCWRDIKHYDAIYGKK